MFARSFFLASLASAASALTFSSPLAADAPNEGAALQEKHFTGADLFGLSVAADPQISPDGSQIAYVRRTNDIMSDMCMIMKISVPSILTTLFKL